MLVEKWVLPSKEVMSEGSFSLSDMTQNVRERESSEHGE